VKDQSHIDEMRAALQGERDRAEQARQRSSETVRALLETEPSLEAPTAPPPEPSSGLRRLFRRR
jgi:hypothetical protein